MVAIVGRHPHETRRLRRAALEEIERAAGAPARPGDRRDRARLLPRPRPARRPAARLRGAARARRARPALPVVIHTRAAEDDTFAMLREHAGVAPRGDPALLLGAGPARRVRRARLPLLVRRQRDLPEGDGPPGRPRASCPPSCCWWRPTRPTSSPQPRARQAQRAGQRAHTAEFVAELRGIELRGARARRSTRTPRASSGRERRAAPGEPAAPAASSACGPTASSARTS